MAAYYCKANGILIYAESKEQAKKYAEHRLSPAYGYQPGRADSLDIKRISAAEAEERDGCSITWEAS